MCSGCNHWVHSRCSLLPSRRAYPGENSWLCPSCCNTPPTTARPVANSPPPQPSQAAVGGPLSPQLAAPAPSQSIVPNFKCNHCGKTIARRRPPPAAYPLITCPCCNKGFHLKCTDFRETKAQAQTPIHQSQHQLPTTPLTTTPPAQPSHNTTRVKPKQRAVLL